jgi:hypothetical protein
MAREDKIIEDAPFDVPPFNEKEFIRKELISFRTTVVLFIFSVVIAGLSYALWRYRPETPFFFHIVLALAVGGIAFRFLFRAAKIDVGHWKRKEWVGTLFLYFFFWLGFFLLFVNPPLTDAASPHVEAAVSPGAQAPGQPITFGAYVADNVGIRAESVQFCIRPYSGTTPTAWSDLSGSDRDACARTFDRADNAFWRHTEAFNTTGRYAFYARAVDVNGHEAVTVIPFDVGSPFTARPSLPRDARFVVPDDRLSVQVDPKISVRAVQFSLDDGASWHNFRLHPDPDRARTGWWTTDPSYTGWTVGDHRVQVRVATQPHFFLHADQVVQNNALDAQGPYNVTVSPDLPSVGTVDPPAYGERRFVHPGQTPGLEAVAVLAALGAALALAGRRRRDT